MLIPSPPDHKLDSQGTRTFEWYLEFLLCAFPCHLTYFFTLPLWGKDHLHSVSLFPLAEGTPTATPPPILSPRAPISVSSAPHLVRPNLVPLFFLLTEDPGPALPFPLLSKGPPRLCLLIRWSLILGLCPVVIHKARRPTYGSQLACKISLPADSLTTFCRPRRMVDDGPLTSGISWRALEHSPRSASYRFQVASGQPFVDLGSVSR